MPRSQCTSVGVTTCTSNWLCSHSHMMWRSPKALITTVVWNWPRWCSIFTRDCHMCWVSVWVTEVGGNSLVTRCPLYFPDLNFMLIRQRCCSTSLLVHQNNELHQKYANSLGCNEEWELTWMPRWWWELTRLLHAEQSRARLMHRHSQGATAEGVKMLVLLNPLSTISTISHTIFKVVKVASVFTIPQAVSA